MRPHAKLRAQLCRNLTIWKLNTAKTKVLFCFLADRLHMRTRLICVYHTNCYGCGTSGFKFSGLISSYR